MKQGLDRNTMLGSLRDISISSDTSDGKYSSPTLFEMILNSATDTTELHSLLETTTTAALLSPTSSPPGRNRSVFHGGNCSHLRMASTPGRKMPTRQ
jgi:hypothetical protein